MKNTQTIYRVVPNNDRKLVTSAMTHTKAFQTKNELNEIFGEDYFVVVKVTQVITETVELATPRGRKSVNGD